MLTSQLWRTFFAPGNPQKPATLGIREGLTDRSALIAEVGHGRGATTFDSNPIENRPQLAQGVLFFFRNEAGDSPHFAGQRIPHISHPFTVWPRGGRLGSAERLSPPSG